MTVTESAARWTLQVWRSEGSLSTVEVKRDLPVPTSPRTNHPPCHKRGSLATGGSLSSHCTWVPRRLAAAHLSRSWVRMSSGSVGTTPSDPMSCLDRGRSRNFLCRTAQRVDRRVPLLTSPARVCRRDGLGPFPRRGRRGAPRKVWCPGPPLGLPPVSPSPSPGPPAGEGEGPPGRSWREAASCRCRSTKGTLTGTGLCDLGEGRPDAGRSHKAPAVAARSPHAGDGLRGD